MAIIEPACRLVLVEMVAVMRLLPPGYGDDWPMFLTKNFGTCTRSGALSRIVVPGNVIAEVVSTVILVVPIISPSDEKADTKTLWAS